MSERIEQVKALSSDMRMEILRSLKVPMENYGHQESANPEEMGVCMLLIAERFAVSQPTMSRHLELLKRANFISTTKFQKWVYCKRNDDEIREYLLWLNETL